MASYKIPFDLQALLCAVGIVISCFLPWFEIHSSVSYLSFGASFSSGASGMASGIGIIPLIGGVIACAMVYAGNKYMSIPGVAVLLFAIAETTGIADYTVNVNFGIGSASSRIGYGLYTLLGCSAVFVLLTFKYLKTTEQTTGRYNTHEVEIPISKEPSQAEDLGRAIGHSVGKFIYSKKPTIELNDKENEENAPQNRDWRYYWVCLLGVLILTWWLVNSKNIQSAPASDFSILHKRARLDSLIRDVNIDISKDDYEMALSKTSDIYWSSSGAEDDERLSKEYDTQQRSLKIIIANLKVRDAISNLQSEAVIYSMLKEKHEDDEKNVQELQKRYKFSAKILDGTSVYKYPDPKSEIDFVPPACTVFITSEVDNGFYYCQLDLEEKRFGWIRAAEIIKN